MKKYNRDMIITDKREQFAPLTGRPPLIAIAITIITKLSTKQAINHNKNFPKNLSNFFIT